MARRTAVATLLEDAVAPGTDLEAVVDYAVRLLDDAVFDAEEQADALADFLPEHLRADVSLATVVEALTAAKASTAPADAASIRLDVPPVQPAPPVLASSAAATTATPPSRPRFRRLVRADIGLDDDATDAAVDVDRPVCRHFLSGECLRADCPFSHDVAQTVCRFWLQGHCLKGDACEFRHALPPPPAAAEDEAALVDEFATLDAADDAEAFPSLASDGADGGVAKAAPGSQPLPYILVGRVARLRAAFGWVPTSMLRDALLRSDGDVDAASEQIRADFPRPVNYRPEAAPSPAPRAVAPRPLAAVPMPRSYLRGAATPHPSLWVDTGAAVSQLYKRLRQEAIDHADQRNQLFQAATTAYRRGDGAAARALSRQGRWHHDRMQELHDQASLALFDERNQGVRQGSEPIVDLHGLHVNEGAAKAWAVPGLGRSLKPDSLVGSVHGGMVARVGTAAAALYFLETTLASLRAQRYGGAVYVITGTGHHSASGRAKLAPAVQRWLSEAGFALRDVSTDRRGGMVQITL